MFHHSNRSPKTFQKERKANTSGASYSALTVNVAGTSGASYSALTVNVAGTRSRKKPERLKGRKPVRQAEIKVPSDPQICGSLLGFY